MIKASGGNNMNTIQSIDNIKSTIKHWKYISHDIHEPQNKDDYNKLSKILDQLLDVVGENEQHELIGLVDVISHMITMYDEQQDYRIKHVSGIEALQFLMKQHHLKQSDLSEIGSQGVVSEVLQGKRTLNIKQIKKLAKRFHVSPSIFIA